jgi:aspartate dehydrogenase
MALTGVAVRDIEKGKAVLSAIGCQAAVAPFETLVGQADIVFDCAVAASHAEIAMAALELGCTLLTMNSGALMADPDLFVLAEAKRARIVVPTGGLAGLDGLRAMAGGGLREVRLTSRKPPVSLADAPHVIAQGYDLSALDAPLCVFSGNARDAARLFPANANVAATLSLAGIGPDATAVEIWADPTVTRITQWVHVVSDEAELKLEILSNAMPDNPRTGSLTPLSAIAALRSLTTSLRVGS